MVAALGGFARVAVLRFEPGEDILNGIVAYCNEQRILNGVVLAMHGSVEGAAFMDVVPRPDLKAQYGYTEETRLDGQTELLGGSGIISHNGETAGVHIHCAFADCKGNVYGGHMVAGNKVLLTVEVALAEVEGINLSGKYDAQRDGTYLHPTQETK